jgi:hypothetical protein
MSSRSKRASANVISAVTSSGRVSKERLPPAAPKKHKERLPPATPKKHICKTESCTTELEFFPESQQHGKPCVAGEECTAGFCDQCAEKTVCEECSDTHFLCPSCLLPERFNWPQGECRRCLVPLCHVCVGEDEFCTKCDETTTFCPHCGVKFFVEDEDFDSSKKYLCGECKNITEDSV